MVNNIININNNNKMIKGNNKFMKNLTTKINTNNYQQKKIKIMLFKKRIKIKFKLLIIIMNIIITQMN